jgi:hypothetical protein
MITLTIDGETFEISERYNGLLRTQHADYHYAHGRLTRLTHKPLSSFRLPEESGSSNEPNDQNYEHA